MMKLLGKIQTLIAQKSLLVETVNRIELLGSKIISSLQPKIGKVFLNMDVETRKHNILSDTRKKLITLAIEDKDIELSQVSAEFDRLKGEYIATNVDSNTFLTKLEKLMNALTQRLNKTMNKKVSFHLGSQQTSLVFVKKVDQISKNANGQQVGKRKTELSTKQN